MKKIFPLLLVLMVMTGCTAKVAVPDVPRALGVAKIVESGVIQVALLLEMNSNFSSLLYDKTEADIKDFQVRPYRVLPEKSSFFVMPVAQNGVEGKSYNKELSTMIANYIRINNFGRVVQDIEEADFIVMAQVDESVQRNFGTNWSRLNVTIMEKDETPVFFAYLRSESRSDRNFFYFPTKEARPVGYLTLKGFEEMFTKALPRAFREG